MKKTLLALALAGCQCGTGDPSFDACVAEASCEESGDRGPEEFCSRNDDGVAAPDCGEEADALGACTLENGRCEAGEFVGAVDLSGDGAREGPCVDEDDALLECIRQ